VVEPFAGSAGYSLRYDVKRATLIEIDPVIAELWRYLITADPFRVLDLPADVQAIADYPCLCPAEQALIGFWFGGGSSYPKKSMSKWGREYPKSSFWKPEIRMKVAAAMPLLADWTIVEGSYQDAPDIEATWFIDPPYQEKGKHYRFGSEQIDYAALADWCRSRRGQVIVCEAAGADWLPFEPFILSKGARNPTREVIWKND